MRRKHCEASLVVQCDCERTYTENVRVSCQQQGAIGTHAQVLESPLEDGWRVCERVGGIP